MSQFICFCIHWLLWCFIYKLFAVYSITYRVLIFNLNMAKPRTPPKYNQYFSAFHAKNSVLTLRLQAQYEKNSFILDRTMGRVLFVTQFYGYSWIICSAHKESV